MQSEIDIPLQGNADRDKVDGNSNSNTSWFLPDGLIGKMNYEFQQSLFKIITKSSELFHSALL